MGTGQKWAGMILMLAVLFVASVGPEKAWGGGRGAGVHTRVLQELLGHASIVQTMRYSHLEPSAKAEAVLKLDPLNSPSVEGENDARRSRPHAQQKSLSDQ